MRSVLLCCFAFLMGMLFWNFFTRSKRNELSNLTEKRNNLEMRRHNDSKEIAIAIVLAALIHASALLRIAGDSLLFMLFPWIK